MVRANGSVLSDIKYKELLEKEATKKPTIAQRINLFFFDNKVISRSDFFWFYGSIMAGVGLAIICYIALHSI
ncbi:hypothetical protein M4D68_00630 [Priestia aryabhattai]|uniref:hypothetical protein n=1 Tax=Priestia aryabhattai TaxID=412384 RepID=UPI0020414336|nr:hypothetical protein [Priestia aryabhattai]MCM3639651.1 hypothetical protein [Priestia aryabhattai]